MKQTNDSESSKGAECFIRSLSDVFQEEANVKIEEAMQLFIKASDESKNSFLAGSGFSGELNAVNLRKHFEVMEGLIDQIDQIEIAINYFKIEGN